MKTEDDNSHCIYIIEDQTELEKKKPKKSSPNAKCKNRIE